MEHKVVVLLIQCIFWIGYSQQATLHRFKRSNTVNSLKERPIMLPMDSMSKPIMLPMDSKKRPIMLPMDSMKPKPIIITLPHDSRRSIEYSQGALQDYQGALQDSQGALQDSQGALQDYQGALQDTQGALQDYQGALQDSQGALQDSYQGALQDYQGALHDTQAALQDSQGGLQDFYQGSLPARKMHDSQGGIHRREFHLRDALQRRLHIPVPRPYYPKSKPKHMRWYQTNGN